MFQLEPAENGGLPAVKKLKANNDGLCHIPSFNFLGLRRFSRRIYPDQEKVGKF